MKQLTELTVGAQADLAQGRYNFINSFLISPGVDRNVKIKGKAATGNRAGPLTRYLHLPLWLAPLGQEDLAGCRETRKEEMPKQGYYINRYDRVVVGHR